MPSSFDLSNNNNFSIPQTLVKSFTIEYLNENNSCQLAYKTNNNYQRLLKIPLEIKAKAIKLTINATHGVKEANVFAFDFNQ